MIENFKSQHIRGNRFRSFADCQVVYPHYSPSDPVFDEIKSKSCVVYCPPIFTSHMFDFLRGCEHKYVLITHNFEEKMEDFFVSEFLYNQKPHNIVKWFSRDAYIQRDDLVHLPLGLHSWAGKTNSKDRLPKIETREKSCIDKIYCNFMLCHPMSVPFHSSFDAKTIDVNKIEPEWLRDRYWIYQNLSNPTFEWEERTNYTNYTNKVASHMFIASPSGSAPDCYRTWESIYLNSIPIVRRNAFNDGYPVIQIDNWDEVTPEFLKNWSKRYNEFNFEDEKLTMNYWKKEIQNSRNLLG